MDDQLAAGLEQRIREIWRFAIWQEGRAGFFGAERVFAAAGRAMNTSHAVVDWRARWTGKLGHVAIDSTRIAQRGNKLQDSIEKLRAERADPQEHSAVAQHAKARSNEEPGGGGARRDGKAQGQLREIPAGCRAEEVRMRKLSYRRGQACCRPRDSRWIHGELAVSDNHLIVGNRSVGTERQGLLVRW